MKAAVLRRPGELAVEDVPEPTVVGDDLLVRVRAASICGTDLRIFKHGHFKIPDGQRRVLGHEVAGDVVAAGPRVSAFHPGMRVTVTPNVGCGRCDMCRHGYNNMCPDYEAFGISIDGGFQELLRVPGFALQRGNVFEIPDGVSYAEAALVEPFSCCYSGQRGLRVGPEDVVVITGAGPIGAFHVLLGKLAGARKVIISNRSRPRLDLAARLGADVCVGVREQDLAEVVREHTDGRGADVVITAVSDPQVQAQAAELLAPHGRLNYFAGLGAARTIPVDTNAVHYKGLTLTGTTGSTNGDYGRCLRLVGERRVDLSPLISEVFPLEKIHDAFGYAASGAGMKAMVAFDGDPHATTTRPVAPGEGR
ncbi:zinc-dependent dehydrogenase [Streptomyces sp. NEAU-YJ-81]|uniref:zinc-dependent dehydrogenase n=1 Tax=Streptomyces sp. NEAU-YJ-81 TaxID=2820288 RepID=UPI001ABC26B6|nr:zinc-dependent dehydrogenase [Streptomyces sp. NEAU-YJ-81]MBO3676390.1 zinc-dependent dehydrogenase [Streptomyces sp. NEAU-YJ-81]